MKNPYLIHPDCREDWLDVTQTASELSVCLLRPVGPNAMLEVRDGHYFQGKGEPYHQHDIGRELFYLVKGRAELTVRRKRCTLEAGDMVFLPTSDPHGLCFPDQETVFRIFLQGMDVSQRRRNRNVIQAYYPELWEDPTFVERFSRSVGAFPRQEPVAVEDVSKFDLFEVRSPAFSLSTFSLPGGVLKLTVGRWETNGLYEIWRCELEQGCKVRWDMPHPDWELYQVTGGAVLFQVLELEFTAKAGELVRIPPFTRHSLEALTSDTVIYDMGCPIRLLSLLEDREALLSRTPEALRDLKCRTEFLKKYNCSVSYFGF